MSLFLIGKSKSPRYFRSVKSLPVKYKENSMCSMTATLFQKCLVSFDNEIRWKAIFILNNCCVNVWLENIALHFEPPNTIAILQPMDHGITSLFKKNYRKEVVQKIIVILAF